MNSLLALPLRPPPVLQASIAALSVLFTLTLISAQDAGVDLSKLARAAMRREAVDPAIFEQIAAGGDRLALNTLVVCCTGAPKERRPAALYALRNFAGTTSIEALAIAFLGDTALGRSTPNTERRAAARALVHFGRAAQEDLERTVLESGDELTRQWAIGGIVTLLRVRGTQEAFDLLLDHYRAPFSGSIEHGARALATFDDERSIERLQAMLLSPKTNNGLREMVAAAVTRQGGDESTRVLRTALRDGDPFVLTRVIDGLRERGETAHTTRLATLARHDSPDVRMAAFRALASAQHGAPDFDKTLRRAFEGHDFALRWGAVSGLADAGDHDSAVWIVDSIDDVHVAVRQAAIEASRTRRIRSAIPALIERLDEDRPRLQSLSREVLIELTGLDHGPRSGRWTAWWEGERDSFVLPGAVASEGKRRARADRGAASPTQMIAPATTTFYGVRFASDRVIFVLDLSGSMRLNGRLERLQAQALIALSEIPDGASFNMVFFSDGAWRWSRRLAVMDADSRRRAELTIKRQIPNGETNLHAGLRAAFEDPDVETIVLLSDGAPSRGVVRMKEIIVDMREWDQRRDIVVHTVSIGEVGGTGLMESIAATTGGEAVASF